MSEKVGKEKKRKRPVEGSSKPSKRVAIEGDKKVKFSMLEPDKWAPVVASIPGLALPSSIPLKAYTQPRDNPPTSGKTPISTTELLLYSSAHQKLDYTAREEEAGGADALLKHYVGIYDPETGNLEVMEARRMVIRGVVRAHQAPAEETNAPFSMREQKNILGQAFGTKKAKKAIASFTENAIAPGQVSGKDTKLDAGAKAMLANIGEMTAGMASAAELAAVAEEAKPRPKHNPDATEIQDVYPVDVLIGNEIMPHIPVKGWIDDLKARNEIITTSRFVSRRLQKVGPNVEKLRILRYMQLLLDMFNKSTVKRDVRLIPKRDKLKEIMGGLPESVVENARRKFSDQGAMSKFKADLLITHLCAMACLVENYEVDLWDLKEDLKMETRDLEKYFREIGAKITALGAAEAKRIGMDRAAAAQHKVAKLKLPLSFPQVSVGRANKRR
ncbi:RNA polymerase I associated factor, A49-like protein [Tricladium varicosporioides]|nr:RNA polymerase I associated factor, A49-like protein [Hymenoscyphus varicosporioides]